MVGSGASASQRHPGHDRAEPRLVPRQDLAQSTATIGKEKWELWRDWRRQRPVDDGHCRRESTLVKESDEKPDDEDEDDDK